MHQRALHQCVSAVRPCRGTMADLIAAPTPTLHRCDNRDYCQVRHLCGRKRSAQCHPRKHAGYAPHGDAACERYGRSANCHSCWHDGWCRPPSSRDLQCGHPRRRCMVHGSCLPVLSGRSSPSRRVVDRALRSDRHGRIREVSALHGTARHGTLHASNDIACDIQVYQCDCWQRLPTTKRLFETRRRAA